MTFSQAQAVSTPRFDAKETFLRVSTEEGGHGFRGITLPSPPSRAAHVWMRRGASTTSWPGGSRDAGSSGMTGSGCSFGPGPARWGGPCGPAGPGEVALPVEKNGSGSQPVTEAVDPRRPGRCRLTRSRATRATPVGPEPRCWCPGHHAGGDGPSEGREEGRGARVRGGAKPFVPRNSCAPLLTVFLVGVG